MGKRGRSLYSLIYLIIAVSFVLVVLVNMIHFTTLSSQDLDEVHHFHSCKCSEGKKSSADFSRNKQSSSRGIEKFDLALRNSRELKNSNEGLIRKEEVWIDVEAQSDRKHVYVSVNGIRVYDINELNDRWRGLHVIVLNQFSGDFMTSNMFDFYGGAENADLVKFLNLLHPDRIVVFLVKDEGSLGFKKLGRNAVKSFGSRLVHQVGFRDNWVCIGKKRSEWVTEAIMKYPGSDVWPRPVQARMSLKLETKLEDNDVCYGGDEGTSKRRLFCKKHDGYEYVCDCKNHKELYKKPTQLVIDNTADSPIVIIASSRPRYLFRMLRKLLSVAGANPKMITVFVDGVYNETIAVAELFGLRVVINEIKCRHNCRIQQHYKKSLSRTFDDFPLAKFAIILEEDLEVSDDIFDYFGQTCPLFESDSSIFCISAWNDQGYQHSVHDPSLLYRVETMPGLGWLLKRSLYKNELEPKWPGPDDQYDWDIWLRMDENRKGRECIIPDISRTYHFGAKGLNVDNLFQNAYFKRRSLNKETGQRFDIEKMKKDNYEKELQRLISNAKILNYTATSCNSEDDIVPDTKGEVYLIFVKMKQNNKYESWFQIAKCFKLWDLDMRDFHNGLIRFWIKENHIIVIGSPDSDYSHYKPSDILPIDIKKKS